MKNITLPVGDTFEIPDPKLLTDSDFVENVLSSGVRVVKQLQDLETEFAMDVRSKEAIARYQVEINQMTSDHERKKEELVRFCQNKDDRIRELEYNIRHLQNELRESTAISLEHGRISGRKEMEDLLNRERQELNERKAELELLRSEKEDYVSRMLKEVRDDVGNVRNIFQKRKGLSAPELGDIGETFANNWIKATFNPADVRVVATEPNSADLLFVHERVHILIEVKNKKELRQDDLTKFHDDIERHKAKGHKYSAALFISLPDVTLINKWKTCYYETRSNMPVLYLGGVLESPILLTAAICALSKMAKAGHFGSSSEEDSSDDESKNEAFRQTALKYLLFVHQTQDDINRDKKLLNEFQARILTREMSLREYMKHEAEILSHFDNIEEELQTLMKPSIGGGVKLRSVKEPTTTDKPKGRKKASMTVMMDAVI
jgi:hypothetical protein